MTLFLKRRLFRQYFKLRNGGTVASDRVFAALARLATGINISAENVRKGAYDPIGIVKPLHITDKKVSSETIALAQDLFEESRSRYSTVAGKVTTILTITGIAISGTIAALSLLGIPSSPVFLPAFVFAVAVYCCTVWFIFKFLAVGTSAAPAIDQEFLDLSNAKKKTALLRNLLSAASQNDFRTNFLVDVYKAARNFSLLSFACACLLIVVAAMARSDREERLILKLRSDPKLVELLRGPKGQQGDVGSAGPMGQPGPRGSPGERGRIYFPSVAADHFQTPSGSLLPSLRLGKPLPPGTALTQDEQVRRESK